ncbi:hypothetical protein PCASD_15924 [Puccinia coronata f. sp. avenae]|uniref:Uncharacterized protein n=1 Tax=Puccinia coronata f. sp. avenae TaxID=200324 RepID=A0A2N5UEZ9_9BASI|nr:hypothetical protein PCASD_15924 [Puccinia coronata f. sp. avenae]
MLLLRLSEAQTISPAEVFKPVDPRTQDPFPPAAIQTVFPCGQSDPNASDTNSTKKSNIGSGGQKAGVPASSHPPLLPAIHPNQTPPQDANPSSQPAGQALQPSDWVLLSILKSSNIQIALMQIYQTRPLSTTQCPTNPTSNSREQQLHILLGSKPSLPLLTPNFLSPSSNDLWNGLDIVDFTLLTKSIELEESSSSEPFTPTTAKSTHSKTTLLFFFGCLQHPSPTVMSDWAKLIAASIEIMAFNLHSPRPPQPHQDDNLVTQGVQALDYYKNMKKTLAFFNTPTNNTSDTVATSVQAYQSSHTPDVLKNFASLIIEACAGYVIF